MDHEILGKVISQFGGLFHPKHTLDIDAKLSTFSRRELVRPHPPIFAYNMNDVRVVSRVLFRSGIEPRASLTVVRCSANSFIPTTYVHLLRDLAMFRNEKGGIVRTSNLY